MRWYCQIPNFPKLCQVLVFMRDETKKAFAMEEQATGPEQREKAVAGRDWGREGERERETKGRKEKGRKGKKDGMEGEKEDRFHCY